VPKKKGLTKNISSAMSSKLWQNAKV
jgi:hypothetical protein